MILRRKINIHIFQLVISIESSSNGGKQWNALTELDLPKSPYTWYDENAVGTNNLYRVFESP